MMSEVKWSRAILFFVVITHAIAFFAFGATFWFDSILYFDLSSYVQSGKLIEYYVQSPGRYMFQHTGLGIPLLWAFAYEAFKHNAWFFYALMQRFFAVIALVYFINSLRKIVPGPWRFCIVILICLSPFYHSLHNAVLTESMAGSLILFFSGLSLRLFYDEQKIPWYTLPLSFLAPMVRAELAIAIPLLFAIHFLTKSFRIKIGLAVLSVLVGFLLIPSLRYLHGDEFLLPNSEFVNPIHAVQTLHNPTAETKEFLDHLDFPTGWTPGYEGLRKMNYRDLCLTWTSYLKSKDMNDSQVRSFFNEITSRLRSDPNVSRLTIFAGVLPTLGIVRWSPISGGAKVYGEIVKDDYLKHEQNHLEWLSWNKSSYVADFSSFIGRYRDEMPNPYNSEAITQYETMVGPHIKDENYLRKLFFVLQVIPTDLFILGTLLFLFTTVAASELRPLSILVLPIMIKFLILFRIGTGDIRYSYEFMPVATTLSTLFIYSLYRIFEKFPIFSPK